MKIYKEDHPYLKKVAEVVDKDEIYGLSSLIEEMKETMEEHDGLGLAAPQVGVSKRLFIIQDNVEAIVCINPEIEESSEEVEKVPEGCLSYPHLWLMVPRNEWVRVKYTDEHGQEVKRQLKGIVAQCFQHELDHLNGVTFTTRVSALHLRMQKEKRKVNRKRRFT